MLKLILTIVQVVCVWLLSPLLCSSPARAPACPAPSPAAADTFLSKNKAKSVDAKLAKMTKWVAILWVVLTLVLCML